MVLRVVPFGVCLDSVKVLAILLGLAIEGKLRGLAIIYRTVKGEDEALLTGVYEKAPRNAVAAAADMLWNATSLINENPPGRRH